MIGLRSRCRNEDFDEGGSVVVEVCDLRLKVKELRILNLALVADSEDKVGISGRNADSPCCRPLRLGQLPAVQPLAVVSIVLGRVEGAKPEEMPQALNETELLGAARNDRKW